MTTKRTVEDAINQAKNQEQATDTKTAPNPEKSKQSEPNSPLDLSQFEGYIEGMSEGAAHLIDGEIIKRAQLKSMGRWTGWAKQQHRSDTQLEEVKGNFEKVFAPSDVTVHLLGGAY